MGKFPSECTHNGSRRFKSRYDFDPSDIRFHMPRMSDENFPKNLELVDRFRPIAAKYGVSTGQITLAWIISEHSDFIPIPGSRSIERLEENAKAGEIVLSPEDVKALREAVDAAEVKGPRFTEVMKKMLAFDSIPLDEWKAKRA